MLRSPLGPLYWLELFRLFRRPGNTLGRVVVLAVLFLTVMLQFPAESSSLKPGALAAFAQQLFWSLVAVKFLVLWFQTPLLACAVLTEEREKQTLDLLLTTTVTGREIVCGKLFARLTYLLFLLMAGIPVMCLLSWFGGITEYDILAAYACLLANLYGLGGLSAGVAASMRSYRAAIYTTWGLSLVLACLPCFGPWIGLRMAFDGRVPGYGAVAMFVVVNVACGFAGLAYAASTVRRVEAARVEVRRLRPKSPDEFPRPKVRRRLVAPERGGRDRNKSTGVPADIDWKSPPHECPGPSTVQVLLLMFVLGVGFGLAVGMTLLEPAQTGRVWRAMMVLAWIPPALLTGVRTAGTVSREREGDTLTVLLTVPAGRAEILWRKFYGGLTAYVWLALGVAFIGFWVFLFSEDRAWYLVFVAQGFGMVLAAASAGLLVSVLSRNTFVAQSAIVLGVLLLGAFPGWLAMIEDSTISFMLPFHLTVCGLAGVLGWLLALDRFYDYAR